MELKSRGAGVSKVCEVNVQGLRSSVPLNIQINPKMLHRSVVLYNCLPHSRSLQ